MAGDSQVPPDERPRGYSTWAQVAGYFGGDGSPKVHMNVYSMTLEVTWTDKDAELIEHLKIFLQSNGVFGVMGKFRRGDNVYCELSVSEGHNALKAMKMMMPYLDKKWSQVKGAVDYLENRITGDEFIEVLNEAIRTKKRSSSPITRSIPYTKSQGKSLARRQATHAGTDKGPSRYHSTPQRNNASVVPPIGSNLWSQSVVDFPLAEEVRMDRLD